MAYRNIWAVPDIHGRSDLLKQGMKVLNARGLDLSQDLLVFLGDMIDRGPDSNEVIETIKQLKEANPDNVVVLRGNHEDFAVDYYIKQIPNSRYIWEYNGGIQTFASYGPSHHMSQDHIKFLGSLPYHHEAQGFFFSHAPVPREKFRRLSFYSISELTWTYYGPESEKKDMLFDKHEGPLSQKGLGTEHLIGLCGHIHRGKNVTEIREFPKYRLLDCGAGCFEKSPLALHECITGETIYIGLSY